MTKLCKMFNDFSAVTIPVSELDKAIAVRFTSTADMVRWVNRSVSDQIQILTIYIFQPILHFMSGRVSPQNRNDYCGNFAIKLEH